MEEYAVGIEPSGDFNYKPIRAQPVEFRAEREYILLAECDNRTPLEKLFDFITAARMSYYRPDQPPEFRQDILCLCCGQPYRPDDLLDGENIYICGSCILTRKEAPDGSMWKG